MFRICVRQLKSLKRYPVPEDVIAAGRLKVVAVVEASPMLHRSPVWTASAAWRPAMAMMVVLVAVTGGAGFVAAHDALPGERLYAVKIVGEEIHERLTLSSDRRFVLQAAHASRRLDETERLLGMQGLAGEDREELIRTAMGRYQDQLFTMNEAAARFEADPKKPQKALRALQAAERIVDRHAQLMESATHAETTVAEMVIDPASDALNLEADVSSAIPADDGGTDGDVPEWRRHAGEVGARLKRMRAELEIRRRREDTGIGGPNDGSAPSGNDEGHDGADDGAKDDHGASPDVDADLDVSYGKALEIAP